MKELTLKYFALLFMFALGQSLQLQAQVQGCTDPLATNYNAAATHNDGSCTYPSATILPSTSINLSAELDQVSGAVLWNDRLWVHNDHTDKQLYELDTLTGEILASHIIPQALHQDWEGLAQDSNYFYIGDFGNNAGGNRTNLHVLRVEKSTLVGGQPNTSTTGFNYAEQSNFQSSGSNNTNYDCEAIIATTNTIFIFSKQWLNQKTRIYVLPKIAGNFNIAPVDSLEVEGLITDATYLKEKNLLVLLGYSNTIQPFIYLFYDFTGNGFFKAHKRKINIDLPYHKTEGIATQDGLKYYVVNEALNIPQVINVPQQLHIFDLSPYLGGYLSDISLQVPAQDFAESPIKVYPNPTDGLFFIQFTENMQPPNALQIYDAQGKNMNLLPRHILPQKDANVLALQIDWLPKGTYWLTSTNEPKFFIKVQKN